MPNLNQEIGPLRFNSGDRDGDLHVYGDVVFVIEQSRESFSLELRERGARKFESIIT